MLGQESSIDGEGFGEITGKRSRTRSNRSPLSAAMVSGAENAGDHGLRISLEIPNDRVYEPYAPGFRSPARTPWPPWSPHTRWEEKMHTRRCPVPKEECPPFWLNQAV